MSPESNSTKPMMVTLRASGADENSLIPVAEAESFLTNMVPFLIPDWL
jgi:hypothetical protein